MGTERTKILVVSGYHPEEIFAVRVGECLFQNNSNPEIKVVRYAGKPDDSDHLEQLILEQNPLIASIILHGDDDLGCEAMIVYLAKTEEEKRLMEELLINFILRYEMGLVDGNALLNKKEYTQIDIELNSRQLSLIKAAELITGFSEYLIDLNLNKGAKL